MCQRVLRLVHSKFASTGQCDHGNRPPSLIIGSRTLDLLLLESLDCHFDVIAHQKYSVRIIFLRRMDSELGRRQSENEPTIACVNVRKLQDVAEKFSIRLGILAVEDHVHSGDHAGQNVTERFSVLLLNYMR